MKNILYITSVVLLSSCSQRYASMGENVYPTDKNGPGVTVPAPLNANNTSHYYDLPAQSHAKAVPIEPPED